MHSNVLDGSRHARDGRLKDRCIQAIFNGDALGLLTLRACIAFTSNKRFLEKSMLFSKKRLFTGQGTRPLPPEALFAPPAKVAC